MAELGADFPGPHIAATTLNCTILRTIPGPSEESDTEVRWERLVGQDLV